MSLLLALTGGPVTITGTLAATETGDTAAFVGLIEHVGTLVVTEGSDTASFTGLINHTGTLAVTEGSDAASFTGLIDHTGVLSVTEAGDTASLAGGVASPAVVNEVIWTQGSHGGGGASNGQPEQYDWRRIDDLFKQDKSKETLTAQILEEDDFILGVIMSAITEDML